MNDNDCHFRDNDPFGYPEEVIAPVKTLLTEHFKDDDDGFTIVAVVDHFRSRLGPDHQAVTFRPWRDPNTGETVSVICSDGVYDLICDVLLNWRDEHGRLYLHSVEPPHGCAELRYFHRDHANAEDLESFGAYLHRQSDAFSREAADIGQEVRQQRRERFTVVTRVMTDGQ